MKAVLEFDNTDDLLDFIKKFSKGEASSTAPVVKMEQKTAPPIEKEEDLGGSSNDDVPTIETIRQNIQAKVTAGHKEKVKEFLTKFGASNATQLKSENYKEFNDLVTAL